VHRILHDAPFALLAYINRGNADPDGDEHNAMTFKPPARLR
jgi:hypothetical protein